MLSIITILIMLLLLIHLTYYLECISSHNLEVYHIFYGSVLRYTYHKEFQLAIKFRLEYFCGIKYLNCGAWHLQILNYTVKRPCHLN